MWFRLVGTPLTATTASRLTAAYGPDGDITALLHAVATDDAFRDESAAMVKPPVDWLVGFMRALGVRPSTLDRSTRRDLIAGLRGMGQVPFLPPSVGGWPAAGAWLTTSAALSRTHTANLVAHHANLGDLSGTTRANRPSVAIQLLGLDAVTGRTRDALAGAADNPVALITAAACSPEYVVSR